MRSHIECTIPSDVAARPARDLRQAVRQQPTCDWWDFKRENHECFTSQVVLDEIASGEAGMGPELLGYCTASICSSRALRQMIWPAKFFAPAAFPLRRERSCPHRTGYR